MPFDALAVLDDKEIQVRNYRPSDLEEVRALCCNTGFLGKPIDPVFADRDLFADFLTGYYLKHEPESAFVVSIKGRLAGYILGCKYPAKHKIYSLLENIRALGKLVLRYGRYNAESKRYIHWLITKAWREVPPAPGKIGHFHINLLPEARSIPICREVLETFLRHLYDLGVQQVHAQMVTFDGRRGIKLFERYGFKVLNQSEITKYRQFTDKSVYLTTIVKDLHEKSDRILFQVRAG
jgi:ribosomal protein S18 acetylase RimI-like enzyme